TGTFSPNNTTLTATYTPSAAEVTAGSTILTLTTTGNGTCGAAVDTMKITYTPAPTNANAGTDQTVCGVTSTTITGNTPTVGSGSWSIVSGAGITITNPNSATTTVTGLAAGSSYTLRWT